MPQSRVALAESLSDTLASLQTARSGLSNAWALRMSASDKAHFAAVMGGAIDSALVESPAFCIADMLEADTNLQDQLQELIEARVRRERRAAAANLKSALAGYVSRTLGECRTSLHDCLAL